MYCVVIFNQIWHRTLFCLTQPKCAVKSKNGKGVSLLFNFVGKMEGLNIFQVHWVVLAQVYGGIWFLHHLNINTMLNLYFIAMVSN